MQLKNNNPVPMEKRTDLASLVCMMGRHGPAVAVAVIAVVSMVAGFIIYRTVKGKRRKAEAGDAGGCSHGAQTDASAPERQPGWERSREMSTDVSELSNAKVATGSRRKLRNRRIPSSSPSKGEVGPEKLCNISNEESLTIIKDEAIKSLHDESLPTIDLNVKDDGNKYNLLGTPNDAEKDNGGCLDPVMVCESLEKEQKLPGSQEGEVITKDASAEIPNEEDDSIGAIGIDEKKNDQTILDSISTEGYQEEPPMHKVLSIKNEKFSEVSTLNEPHTTNEDVLNMAHYKSEHDQNIALISPTFLDINSADAEESQNSEGTENVLTKLGELSADCGVTLSSNELEHEQHTPTCSNENFKDVGRSSLDELQETSILFSSVPPGLPVEPEAIHNDHVQPLVGQQNEMKEIASQLTEGTSGDLFSLACSKKEVETTNFQIPKGVEKLLPSADGELEAIADEVSSVVSMSTEISCPNYASFQYQESEHLENIDILDIPTVPTPGMEVPIKDQLMYVTPSNLTWYSSDVGQESGISSMTVSPDLPNECMLTSKTILEDSPQSTDVAELPTTKGFDLESIKKEPANVVLDKSNDAHLFKDNGKPYESPIVELCNEIEDLNRVVCKLPIDAPLEFCLNEDLGAKDTKAVKEGKCEIKSKDKTEINIMEATMDHNEWITESTDPVLPWIKASVHSVPLIKPVSQEQYDQPTFPLEDPCRKLDVAPVTGNEETNTIASIDEAKDTGKRVLAVHPMPQNVSVTFQIHYLTHTPYQMVAITGNHRELGNWKDFVPLEETKDGFWVTVVSLPGESRIEWKFVVVDRGEVCRWEECGNRFLDTGNVEDLLVYECWGVL